MVLIKPCPSFYSADQLDAYLKCIRLGDISREPTLETLTRIGQQHLCRFPFENTSMQYTESGAMDITPAAVYERFLSGKGGSYCFGHSLCMLGMLRAMGYRAYATAARGTGGMSTEVLEFSQPRHIVLFVQIPRTDGTPPQETYIVDVGVNLMGPARPILLKEGEVVMGAAPPEKHRLIKGPMPNSSLDETDAESRDVAENWMYQVNLDTRGKPLEEGSWRIMFAFSMEEYSVRDFEAFSFVVTYKPGGILNDRIMASRWTPIEGDGGLFARIVLSKRDRVMWYGGEEVRTLKELHCAEDRIEALRKYFGITIERGGESYLRDIFKFGPKA
ncbi:N-terminal acetyltransferase [Tulasnella sp. JGI-2019a]|nr:N-terminal acetyltransferase [Tulasnella sp. JGI-2019a]